MPETFEAVRRLRERILFVSRRIGVSPIAVAGAIADEYNAQLTEWDGYRKWLDGFQDAVFDLLPEFVFELSVWGGAGRKLMNATRNDIGDGNINVATARALYDEFKACFRDEPIDMVDFVGADRDKWHEIVDFVLSSEGTVVLAALVIKKAMRELAAELHGRSPEIQEAIVVTYYKQGPRYVRKFQRRLAENADATLIPGEGCRVYHQRAQFMSALEITRPEVHPLPSAPSCW